MFVYDFKSKECLRGISNTMTLEDFKIQYSMPLSQAQWHVPAVSATWEAEAGVLLQPRNLKSAFTTQQDLT